MFTGSPVASATSVEELKGARLGAAIGTTSLLYIEDVIQPDSPAQVYDDNAAAKAAFDAGQVDGLVFDLPTAVKAVSMLLLVSVLVAGLGVANTLALSVYERTREIGLLRAVGTTRRQIRKIVRREAVITSVFGGLLGVAVGTTLGIAAVKVLPDALSGTLVIPWSWIILCIFVTVIMGLFAALWPAWRASRMNVLDAISQE